MNLFLPATPWTILETKIRLLDAVEDCEKLSEQKRKYRGKQDMCLQKLRSIHLEVLFLLFKCLPFHATPLLSFSNGAVEELQICFYKDFKVSWMLLLKVLCKQKSWLADLR